MTDTEKTPQGTRRRYAAPKIDSYSAAEIQAALGPALASYGGPP